MILSFALSQRRNNFTKRRKTQIDGFELQKLLRSHAILLVDFLASCQITEVKFTSKQHSSFISCVTLHQNLENSMRSGRMNISSSLSRDSITLTSLEQLKAIIGIIDYVFRLALNEYACVLVFSDIQSSGWFFILE